jgi:hypothetical protein
VHKNHLQPQSRREEDRRRSESDLEGPPSNIYQFNHAYQSFYTRQGFLHAFTVPWRLGWKLVKKSRRLLDDSRPWIESSCRTTYSSGDLIPAEMIIYLRRSTPLKSLYMIFFSNASAAKFCAFAPPCCIPHNSHAMQRRIFLQELRCAGKDGS